jgi:hypothetical protein
MAPFAQAISLDERGSIRVRSRCARAISPVTAH